MRQREIKRLEHHAAKLEIASMDLGEMHERLCEQEHALEQIVNLLKKLKDGDLLQRARKVQNLLCSASGEIMVFGEDLSEEAEQLMEQADQN